ncbi:unnamed protein product (macronuclear) [Paramecium tetraurelia]|uniref:Uncharacterized protein n=1 Tax=Paramecium tetraurelia TaxID=5888 RepID=A0C0C2_PARTE|nr:uncharacterized protein GSPATT00006092001 [Paramecium tetraurelia]CAK64239.1 unnamed protein product [Paramecium tetraurelia]|eukprot:XP_001431637.1 hypothetical protein (macronuclear) [Paramecium tetraurelia strain d4-2]
MCTFQTKKHKFKFRTSLDLIWHLNYLDQNNQQCRFQSDWKQRHPQSNDYKYNPYHYQQRGWVYLTIQQNIMKAKFQIMTVIVSPNDDIDIAFQRANSEQIQMETLKTKPTIEQDTQSLISEKSHFKSTIAPKQIIPIVPINHMETPLNEKKDQFQPTVLHLLIVGTVCLLIGYFAHMNSIRNC